MTDLVGSPDIILVWPVGREAPEAGAVDGYSVTAIGPERDPDWIDVHRRAVPSFAHADLATWLARYRSLALPDGVLLATDDATGEAVATAGSIANDKDGMFPGGGQLAWVATVPDRQGRGLGTWLSALATGRLLADGFRTIFLCTGDDLAAAIHVYLRLGYLPCIYASDQRDRWGRICEEIGHPFEPDRWPTRDEYVKESS